MSREYAIEKLYLAVLGLMAGTGEIHQRLESAANTLHTLDATRDFPTDLQGRFTALWDSLTREEAESKGEGRIRATIRKMTPDDAAKLAEQIFDLYFGSLGITPFGHPRG